MLRKGVWVEEEGYMVLRMRLIKIWLLVTGGMGRDLDKLGIGKVIIWETLR